MAATTSSRTGTPVTRTSLLPRSMATASTPGTFRTSAATAATQCSQVMPGTTYVVVGVTDPAYPRGVSSRLPSGGARRTRRPPPARGALLGRGGLGRDHRPGRPLPGHRGGGRGHRHRGRRRPHRHPARRRRAGAPGALGRGHHHIVDVPGGRGGAVVTDLDGADGGGAVVGRPGQDRGAVEADLPGAR